MIVVDNGSTDDSGSRIRQEFPWVDTVDTGKNLGFAGGCNFGIRRALSEGTDYVWLLNPDTTVDPEALDALVDKAESDAQIGAVGSAIYCMDNPQDLQAWGGGYVNFWTGRARHFLAPVADASIQYITGASLLVPKRVLHAMGLLDEQIFLYWEDTEYSWRLRTAGWKLAVASQSRVWHKSMSESRSRSARRDSFYNASAALFFRRYSSIPLLSIWVGASLRIVKRLLLGDWESARAAWVGTRQGEYQNRSQSTDVRYGYERPRCVAGHETGRLDHQP